MTEATLKTAAERHLDDAKRLVTALRDLFPVDSERWRWYETELARINVARWGL